MIIPDEDIDLDALWPGDCPLTGQPLGLLRDVARIPPFQHPDPGQSLITWPGRLSYKFVRFDSWQRFDLQSKIVEWYLADGVSSAVGVRELGTAHTKIRITNFDGDESVSLYFPRSALFRSGSWGLGGATVQCAEFVLGRDPLAELLGFLRRQSWPDGAVVSEDSARSKRSNLTILPNDTDSAWLQWRFKKSELFRLAKSDLRELCSSVYAGL